ncbi:MAG: phosphate ABC transporter substrate-binding protein PstS [Thermoproteota archaeon]
MDKKKVMITVSAVVLAGILAYVFIVRENPGESQKEITLNGAGATFPFPLVDKWIAEYNKLKPNVRINYQPIGSGGGIRQHTEKTVYFAASDAPMNKDQMNSAPNTLHIPITIGGVVPIYNIPGVGSGIKFTGEIISKIFLGEITSWSDPEIQEVNPSINLPNSSIVVVHRSDGSGTTFVWTTYLSSISQKWRNSVGVGVSVNWPTGLGGKGNDGVAALVQQTPHSIGYVEYTYAKKNNLTYGYVQNAAGEFVEPSIDSFSKAASYAAAGLPKGDENWEAVSMVKSLLNNRQATGAYPITSFSYVLVYKELNVLPEMDEAAARALVEFLWWAIHDGQNYAADLYYVPLPSNVISHNENTIRMITFNGKQVSK